MLSIVAATRLTHRDAAMTDAVNLKEDNFCGRLLIKGAQLMIEKELIIIIIAYLRCGFYQVNC